MLLLLPSPPPAATTPIQVRIKMYLSSFMFLHYTHDSGHKYYSSSEICGRYYIYYTETMMLIRLIENRESNLTASVLIPIAASVYNSNSSGRLYTTLAAIVCRRGNVYVREREKERCCFRLLKWEWVSSSLYMCVCTFSCTHTCWHTTIKAHTWPACLSVQHPRLRSSGEGAAHYLCEETCRPMYQALANETRALQINQLWRLLSKHRHARSLVSALIYVTDRLGGVAVNHRGTRLLRH